MIWRVEIQNRPGVFDSFGSDIQKSIEDLGIHTISEVRVARIFHIEGEIGKSQISQIAAKLLVDPVIQNFQIYSLSHYQPVSPKGFQSIEIAHNFGVMDPVEESTLKGIRDLGIEGVKSVRTAKRFFLKARLTASQRETIINKVLANKLIQHVVDFKKEFSFPERLTKERGVFDIILVDLLGANDHKLMELNREGQLFLNLEEMRTIKKYFRKKGRNPTDCELETIAQTWSEHCHHKTFRGKIEYEALVNGKKQRKCISNLLKSTIMKATKEIKKPWCVSVFHDNAGVIQFDKKSHICFKVETHNHPSALEPFGGANTGIGGVLRDILGTGLGAKPICNTDVFCFAPPDYPFSKLPPGTLHPKRIMKGVVSGVRDYGNKMGIPTVNGAILFDEGFVGNPLVYCGTVGILPKEKVKKKARSGDKIVVVGGKTGRDGIHGATFSSGELTQESETVSSGAVQIGDPIQEKKMQDVLLQARDENLYTAITDCGAGGLSSAVGEMGKETGARVYLEKVPLKYEGLTYTETWISESQERMILAVPPKKVKKLLKIFEAENVEATVIGEFTNTHQLELFYYGCQVCELDMDFLHEGIPAITKKAVWKPKKIKEKNVLPVKNLTQRLHGVLSHKNVCSKEWVIRQYDHEVQGGSIIKPLVGACSDGPSDASVVRPKLDSKQGVAVANGINIRYGMIDPFWMAASCIDEAVRQVVAVGGNPDKIAILDNFCWGNPDKPDRLGGLVRAAEGCYMAAKGYKVPFISGKDSLYNEYTVKGQSISIPGTLLISAVGIVDDIEKATTMDFKWPESLIYIIGETQEELGGSIYFDTQHLLGNSVPKIWPDIGRKTFRAIQQAIGRDLVLAVHDCSEGGLGVAIAEMAFSGGRGATIFLSEVPYTGKNWRDDYILFSESNSRFVVEVPFHKQKEFEKLLKGIPFGLIGCTEEEEMLTIYGITGQVCVEERIFSLKESWQKPLRW